MRLTKQLKAQANSLKFASQIPTSGDLLLRYNQLSVKENENYHLNHHRNNDVVIVNRIDEISRAVSLNTNMDNYENSKTSMNTVQGKLPTIIMTSHSDGALRDDRRVSIQCYHISRHNQHDDQCSLNSASIQDEQVML